MGAWELPSPTLVTLWTLDPGLGTTPAPNINCKYYIKLATSIRDVPQCPEMPLLVEDLLLVGLHRFLKHPN